MTITKIFTFILSFLLMTFGGISLAATASATGDTPSEVGKVDICHAGGQPGKYESTYVSVNSVNNVYNVDFNGHGDDNGQHVDDIIPPIPNPSDASLPLLYAGKNWNSTNEAILKNGCATKDDPEPNPTVTVYVDRPVPGPTVTVSVPGPTVTVTAAPVPGPTVTVTAEPVPAPTVTVTATATETATINGPQAALTPPNEENETVTVPDEQTTPVGVPAGEGGSQPDSSKALIMMMVGMIGLVGSSIWMYATRGRASA
jgi:hypothetical protein